MPEKPAKPEPTVVILRNPDDPLCLRISIGGTAHIGYYFNFRGDPLDVILMLGAVSKAFKEAVTSGKFRTR